VKIIREMGYGGPIVALTANVVAGQADIFLKNGFNDYISKPIDIRQLNVVLNKLVRDKQPPEVLEAARKSAGQPAARQTADAPPQPEILNPRTAEIFIRDAQKAIAALGGIFDKNEYRQSEGMRSYVIHVHGIKSALANIGKMELSAAAAKLEIAGQSENYGIINLETSAFLASLSDYVDELKKKIETPPAGNSAGETGLDNESGLYLVKKLNDLKTACEGYDENAADAILNELREITWPKQIRVFLVSIAEKLLHSDFDEIAGDIAGFCEGKQAD